MKIYLIDYENVNEQGLEGVKALQNGDLVNIFYSVNIKSMPFERSIELAQSQATVETYLIKKTGKNYLDFQLTTLLGYLICKYEQAEFFIVSKDTGFDSTVDFWKERKVTISRVTSIAGGENKKGKAKDIEVKKTEPKKLETQKNDAQKPDAQKPETQKNDAQKAKTKKTETKKADAKKSGAKKAKEKPIQKPALPESYRKKVRAALEGEKLAPNHYTGIYKALVESKDKVLLNNALVKQFDNTKGGVIYGKIKNIYIEYQENEAKKS